MCYISRRDGLVGCYVVARSVVHTNCVVGAIIACLVLNWFLHGFLVLWSGLVHHIGSNELHAYRDDHVICILWIICVVCPTKL